MTNKIRLRPCNDPDEPCPYLSLDHPEVDYSDGVCLRLTTEVTKRSYQMDKGCGEHPAVVAERKEMEGAALERGLRSVTADPMLSWQHHHIERLVDEINNREWQTGDPPEPGEYLTVIDGEVRTQWWGTGIEGWDLDEQDHATTHWQPLPAPPSPPPPPTDPDE